MKRKEIRLAIIVAILVAAAFGWWRFSVTRLTAQQIFGTPEVRQTFTSANRVTAQRLHLLEGDQFNQSGAWVTSATPNGFHANLGRIGSLGQDVQVIASFAELPGYTPSNDPREMMMEIFLILSGCSDTFHSFSQTQLTGFG